MAQAEDDEITRKVVSEAVTQILKQPTTVRIEIIIEHLDGSRQETTGILDTVELTEKKRLGDVL